MNACLRQQTLILICRSVSENSPKYQHTPHHLRPNIMRQCTCMLQTAWIIAWKTSILYGSRMKSVPIIGIWVNTIHFSNTLRHCQSLFLFRPYRIESSINMYLSPSTKQSVQPKVDFPFCRPSTKTYKFRHFYCNILPIKSPWRYRPTLLTGNVMDENGNICYYT